MALRDAGEKGRQEKGKGKGDRDKGKDGKDADPASRKDEDGNAVFRVVGPGPVERSKSRLDALYEYMGWTAAAPVAT